MNNLKSRCINEYVYEDSEKRERAHFDQAIQK